MTYEQANSFGESIKKWHEELAYNVIEVPFASPAKRAQFILNMITNNE
jgi:predicted ATPase